MTNKDLLHRLRERYLIDITMDQLKEILAAPPEEADTLHSFTLRSSGILPIDSRPKRRVRRRRSARTCAKISAAMVGTSNFAGKHHTAAAKRKISESRRGL